MWDDKTQEELEEAFQTYLDYVRRELPDTVSARLAPEFLRCDQARKTYTIAYRTEAWMSNPNRLTHGGIIAAMLDTAMGVMTHVHAPGRLTSTITMQVNYVLPVPLDRLVHVDVDISRIGGTMAHVTGRMYDPEQPEATLATASGVYHLGRRRG